MSYIFNNNYNIVLKMLQNFYYIYIGIMLNNNQFHFEFVVKVI